MKMAWSIEENLCCGKKKKGKKGESKREKQ